MAQFLHARDFRIYSIDVPFSLMELGVPLDASLPDCFKSVLLRGGLIFASFDALVHIGEFSYSELSRELVGADLGVLLGDRLFL